MLGVVPDSDYVPDLPGKLFQEGRFDRSIAMMTGHNQDEDSPFVPNTLVTNKPSYEAYLKTLILSLATNITAVNTITKKLYPPIFNGSQGYTTQVERNNLTIADATIICNACFMGQASFRPTTYAYEFSVPPGVHGFDLSFTFYDFEPTSGVNVTVAETLQRYLARFAKVGQPNGPTLPLFPPARPGSTVQNLGSDFIGPVLDDCGVKQLSQRYKFWQDVPYLSAR